MASKHFEAGADDERLARKIAQVIAERFPEQLCALQGIERKPHSELDIPDKLRPDESRIASDILTVHTRGNKLRLQQMYNNLDTYDVVHDVLGIVQYLDREASAAGDVVLRDFFQPRYTDYDAFREPGV